MIARDWRVWGGGGRGAGGSAIYWRSAQDFGYMMNESWRHSTGGPAASNAALCDLNFTKRIVLMVSVFTTKQQQGKG